MGPRRQGREAAFQIIYQLDVNQTSTEAALTHYWNSLQTACAGRAFAEELVRGYWEKREPVDTLLRDVSAHWRLERMSRVDRAILRLGAYELLARPDIPGRVSINEAVELAKRFGEASSPSFVNGVLDRIASDLKKA